MSAEVTDPTLLAQLNAPGEVHDPAVLAQLNGENTDSPFTHFMRSVAQNASHLLGDVALPAPINPGISNLAMQAVKGANNALVGTAALVPDAAIQGYNALTGNHTPLTSEAWKQYSDSTIPPPSNPTEQAFNVGGGLLAGAAVPIPGGAASNPAGKLAESLAIARNAGYVVPKSAVSPTVGTRTLEALVGQKELAAEATQKNSKQMLENLGKQFNLPAGTEITHDTMSAVRADAGKAYEAIASKSPAYAQLVDTIKSLRNEASGLYKKSAANYDPDVVKQADAAWQKAQEADQVLAGALKQDGSPEMMADYLNARKVIAQTHDVDKAIVDSRAQVLPKTFATAYGKEKPQSGAIYDIGRSAQAFGPAFNTNPGQGGAWGGLDKVLIGSGAGLYELAHMPKLGAATVAAAVARHAARKALLSGPVQDMMLLSPEQKQAALAEALMRGGVASQEQQ